jgi:Xaa-Pro aminopeptidase
LVSKCKLHPYSYSQYIELYFSLLLANADTLAKELEGHTLSPISPNPVDQVWGESRPAAPGDKVFVHPLKYSGLSHTDKIKNLRTQLEKEKADLFVLTSLDEIACKKLLSLFYFINYSTLLGLFNLRGSDVSFNPVFISYALVSLHDVILYIDESKVAEVKEHLGKEVTIKPYDAIFDDLKSFASEKKKIWLDAARSCVALFNAVGDSSLVLEKGSPITLPKALKNEVELEGLRQAHIRDAAALVRRKIIFIIIILYHS